MAQTESCNCAAVDDEKIDTWQKFKKAKEYFESIEGVKIPQPKVNIKADNLLRDFIEKGGFDIPMPNDGA